jgi:hypothetical protein
MTNAEKFEKVFGFSPNEDLECPMPTDVCYVNNEICNNCPFDDFWQKEYKPCFKLDLSNINGSDEQLPGQMSVTDWMKGE